MVLSVGDALVDALVGPGHVVVRLVIGQDDAVFQATGTRILRTDVQAPRMNAICERLVGTLRRALLDRVLMRAVERVAPALFMGPRAYAGIVAMAGPTVAPADA